MAMHPTLVTHVRAHSTFLAWIFCRVDSGGFGIFSTVKENIGGGRRLAPPRTFYTLHNCSRWYTGRTSQR